VYNFSNSSLYWLYWIVLGVLGILMLYTNILGNKAAKGNSKAAYITFYVLKFIIILFECYISITLFLGQTLDFQDVKDVCDTHCDDQDFVKYLYYQIGIDFFMVVIYVALMYYSA
jgi:bacteriorhodopsin